MLDKGCRCKGKDCDCYRKEKTNFAFGMIAGGLLVLAVVVMFFGGRLY